MSALGTGHVEGGDGRGGFIDGGAGTAGEDGAGIGAFGEQVTRQVGEEVNGARE